MNYISEHKNTWQREITIGHLFLYHHKFGQQIFHPRNGEPNVYEVSIIFFLIRNQTKTKDTRTFYLQVQQDHSQLDIGDGSIEEPNVWGPNGETGYSSCVPDADPNCSNLEKQSWQWKGGTSLLISAKKKKVLCLGFFFLFNMAS